MNETEMSTSDARLDDVLTAWAREHEASPATLLSLHRSIVAAEMVREPARQVRNSGALAAVCVVAASLLVAAAVLYKDSGQSSDHGPMARTAGRDSRTTLAVLWKETGRLFGSDLAWVGDLDGELLLGVDDSNGADRSAGPVYVLLTLREFDSVRGTWVNSWTGRFACRAGSTVDFATADQRTAGSIWVQSRPNGDFAVSHWLNWQEHPELSGSVDTTVSADKPKVIAERTAAGHKVQIVQQVWRPDVG